MQRSIVSVFSLSLVIITLIAASCDVSNVRNIDPLPADGDTNPVEPAEDGDITEEDRDLWQDIELPVESDPDSIETPDSTEEDGDQWWDEEIPAESEQDIIEIPDSIEYPDVIDDQDSSDPYEINDSPEELDDIDAVDNEETPLGLDMPTLQPVPLPDNNTDASYISSLTLQDNSIVIVYRWHGSYQWAHSSTNRGGWDIKPFAIPDAVTDHIKQQIQPPAAISDDGEGGFHFTPLDWDQWELVIAPAQGFRSWQDAQGFVHLVGYGRCTDMTPPVYIRPTPFPTHLLDLKVNPETMEITASVLHDFFTADNLFRWGDDDYPRTELIYSGKDYSSQTDIIFKPRANGCNEAFWTWSVHNRYEGPLRPAVMHCISCDGTWGPWEPLYTIGDAPGTEDDEGYTITKMQPVYDHTNSMTDDWIVTVNPSVHIGIHMENDLVHKQIIAAATSEPYTNAYNILAAYRFEHSNDIELVMSKLQDSTHSPQLYELTFQTFYPDTAWNPGPVNHSYLIPPRIDERGNSLASRYAFEDHISVAANMRRVFLRYYTSEDDHPVQKSLEFNHTFTGTASLPHEITLLEGKQPGFFDSSMGISLGRYYFPNAYSSKVDTLVERALHPFDPYIDLDSANYNQFQNLCFYRENNQGIREPARCPLHETLYGWEVSDGKWLKAGNDTLPVLTMTGNYFSTFDPLRQEDSIQLYPLHFLDYESANPSFEKSTALLTGHREVSSLSITPQDRSLSAKELISREDLPDLVCSGVSTSQDVTMLKCSYHEDPYTTLHYRLMRCNGETCEEPFEIELPDTEHYSANCTPRLYHAGDQLRMSCIQYLGVSYIITFASDDNGETWSLIGEDFLGYTDYVLFPDWFPSADGQMLAGMVQICGADDSNPDGCHLNAYTLTPGDEVVTYSPARHLTDRRLSSFKTDFDAQRGTISAMWVLNDDYNGLLPDYADPNPNPRNVYAVIYDIASESFSPRGTVAAPAQWDSDLEPFLGNSNIWYRDGNLCITVDSQTNKVSSTGNRLSLTLWGCSQPEW